MPVDSAAGCEHDSGRVCIFRFKAPSISVQSAPPVRAIPPGHFGDFVTRFGQSAHSSGLSREEPDL